MEGFCMKYIKFIAITLVLTAVSISAIEQKESKSIFVNIKQRCSDFVQTLKNKTIYINKKKKSELVKNLGFDVTGSFDITRSNKKLKIGGTEIAKIEIEAGDKKHQEHLI